MLSFNGCIMGEETEKNIALILLKLLLSITTILIKYPPCCHKFKDTSFIL